MESNNINSVGASSSNSARKSYSSPQLRTYGDLRMLTEGGSVNATETAPPTPVAPMLMMHI